MVAGYLQAPGWGQHGGLSLEMDGSAFDGVVASGGAPGMQGTSAGVVQGWGWTQHSCEINE